MTKEWVAAKDAERIASIQCAKEKIRQKIISHGFSEEEAGLVLGDLEDSFSRGVGMLVASDGYKKIESRCHADADRHSLAEKWHNLYIDTMDDIYELRLLQYSFDRFLDSDPVEFDGDIIITDPCYVLVEGENHHDDWVKCGCGDDMGELGITHFMSRDTIIGDWSCAVFDTVTKQKIGEFCADAGMVSVLSLDEVLKYNPSFDYHINRKWTTAWIKNFKGTVQFVIHEEKFIYEGKECTDYDVEVVGYGINKKTGKPINFTTRQTGL